MCLLSGGTAKYLIKNTEAWVIDEKLISKLEKEVEDVKKMDMDASTNAYSSRIRKRY